MGTLLILGAPGAGKTTLLLELARDLIDRAEQDESHPIPVVFNLSSWAEKRQPLKEWLVEELTRLYDVPRRVAQEWMDADALLPLLDGLDEVVADYRGACVEVINSYRQEHGLVPLTVCSRVADYEALSTRLRLQGAVVVQTLTPQQVDVYLERAGEKLEGVRRALHGDAELREMLDTPLMLSIVTLAYAEKSAAEVQAAGTPDERRRHLFDAYIAAMFRRRSKTTGHSEQQALRWLCWLARRMTQQAQTVFLVERLQPEWLSTRAAQLQYMLLDRCIGVLVGVPVAVLAFGLVAQLLFAELFYGLVSGVLYGLLYGLATLFFGGKPPTKRCNNDRLDALSLMLWSVR